MTKKRPANKLDIKVNKLRIAINKTKELDNYLMDNELEFIEGGGRVSVESAVFCDVLEPLEKEYNRLYRKLEGLQARWSLMIEKTTRK